jgi:hypothetical protein
MVMTWRALLLLTVLAPSIRAGEHSTPVRTLYETRLALFGSAPEQLRLDTIPSPQTLLISQPARKSVGMAILYSLILPGMGELYAENFSTGRYFLAAEGALWLTYAGFGIYGNSVRDDARSFAVVHAGVNLAGKNDQFFVDIGNFISIDEYNQKKLRDRDPDKVYNPALGYAWQWDSDASRSAFRDRRVTSETAYNNMRFVVAAILINHVASAINAARAAISHNNALANTLGELRVSADVLGGIAHPHGIMITVAKGF